MTRSTFLRRNADGCPSTIRALTLETEVVDSAAEGVMLDHSKKFAHSQLA
jgi:hypothetical protein